MSTRVRMVVAVSLFVAIALLQGYAMLGSDTVSRSAISRMGQKTHPFSPLDFVGGMFIGGMISVIIILISLRESFRFEREIKKDGDDQGPKGSGGGQRQIRLPMSRKVVSIKDFRKTPTDGHIHREMLPA